MTSDPSKVPALDHLLEAALNVKGVERAAQFFGETLGLKRIGHVESEQRITWDNGARSIYFRDPDGNGLEFAEPRMWGIT